MAKMTKLKAFKGRERGQNNRRKREAVGKAIKKVVQELHLRDDMAIQATRENFDHFRFPRSA